MPVRSPRHLGHNIIGYFPSIKLKRSVAFESTIECDYCYELDFRNEVRVYEEQPFSIEYQVDDKRRKYTPDFRVEEIDKIIVVECKAAAMIPNEDNQRRFAIGRQWCEEHRYEYRVVTDDELRTGYRLENVKTLWRFGQHVVAPEIKAKVFSLLFSASQPLTIAQVASMLYQDDIKAGMRVIYHLAFFHQVAIPLDGAIIEPDSIVTLPTQLNALISQDKSLTQ